MSSLAVRNIGAICTGRIEQPTVPGDILLTGTPEGVGYARNPPEYLGPGDEITVTSPAIGSLSNRVVERSLIRD